MRRDTSRNNRDLSRIEAPVEIAPRNGRARREPATVRPERENHAVVLKRTDLHLAPGMPSLQSPNILAAEVLTGSDYRLGINLLEVTLHAPEAIFHCLP